MDDESVLVEAPNVSLPQIVVMCEHMDRERFMLDEPEWARLSIRLADSFDYSAADHAIITTYVPGVPIMVRVHPPQHGRCWELDIMHRQGPNTVVLGPAMEAV